MSRDRVPLAVLLCTGLLLSLVGPRPASLERVPPGPAAPAGPASPAAEAWPAAPVTARAGAFRWPLDGAPRVVRRFDPPPQPWLPGHRGVNLAGMPGATVRAAGAGRVRFAGRIAGRFVVSVDHAGGLRTTYEPVEPVVRTGDEVAAGDPIGRLASGHPGCTVSACLHWGLRRGDMYLDPLALLGLAQVRLLPLA
jgi:murein DD-endopeptidase MepM/ murein hydrolase activator NlpD